MTFCEFDRNENDIDYHENNYYYNTKSVELSTNEGDKDTIINFAISQNMVQCKLTYIRCFHVENDEYLERISPPSASHSNDYFVSYTLSPATTYRLELTIAVIQNPLNIHFPYFIKLNVLDSENKELLTLKLIVLFRLADICLIDLGSNRLITKEGSNITRRMNDQVSKAKIAMTQNGNEIINVERGNFYGEITSGDLQELINDASSSSTIFRPLKLKSSPFRPPRTNLYDKVTTDMVNVNIEYLTDDLKICKFRLKLSDILTDSQKVKVILHHRVGDTIVFMLDYLNSEHLSDPEEYPLEETLFICRCENGEILNDMIFRSLDRANALYLLYDRYKALLEAIQYVSVKGFIPDVKTATIDDIVSKNKQTMKFEEFIDFQQPLIKFFVQMLNDLRFIDADRNLISTLPSIDEVNSLPPKNESSDLLIKVGYEFIDVVIRHRSRKCHDDVEHKFRVLKKHVGNTPCLYEKYYPTPTFGVFYFDNNRPLYSSDSYRFCVFKDMFFDTRHSNDLTYFQTTLSSLSSSSSSSLSSSRQPKNKFCLLNTIFKHQDNPCNFLLWCESLENLYLALSLSSSLPSSDANFPKNYIDGVEVYFNYSFCNNVSFYMCLPQLDEVRSRSFAAILYDTQSPESEYFIIDFIPIFVPRSTSVQKLRICEIFSSKSSRCRVPDGEKRKVLMRSSSSSSSSSLSSSSSVSSSSTMILIVSIIDNTCFYKTLRLFIFETNGKLNSIPTPRKKNEIVNVFHLEHIGDGNYKYSDGFPNTTDTMPMAILDLKLGKIMKPFSMKEDKKENDAEKDDDQDDDKDDHQDDDDDDDKVAPAAFEYIDFMSSFAFTDSFKNSLFISIQKQQIDESDMNAKILAQVNLLVPKVISESHDIFLLQSSSSSSSSSRHFIEAINNETCTSLSVCHVSKSDISKKAWIYYQNEWSIFAKFFTYHTPLFYNANTIRIVSLLRNYDKDFAPLQKNIQLLLDIYTSSFSFNFKNEKWDITTNIKTFSDYVEPMNDVYDDDDPNIQILVAIIETLNDKFMSYNSPLQVLKGEMIISILRGGRVMQVGQKPNFRAVLMNNDSWFQRMFLRVLVYDPDTLTEELFHLQHFKDIYLVICILLGMTNIDTVEFIKTKITDLIIQSCQVIVEKAKDDYVDIFDALKAKTLSKVTSHNNKLTNPTLVIGKINVEKGKDTYDAFSNDDLSYDSFLS